MNTTAPQRNQPVSSLNKPIFTADPDERLPDDATDPCSPHPLYPPLSNEEKTQAKDMAISYFTQHADRKLYQYAFIRKEGHEAVQSMPGNQIQVSVHRMRNGVPINGAGLRFIVDRDTWALNQVVDSLELFDMKVSGDDPFLEPTVSIEEAWDKLKNKVKVQLSYRLDTDSSTHQPIARLVHTIDCDWVCNAVTGELTKLK